LCDIFIGFWLSLSALMSGSLCFGETADVLPLDDIGALGAMSMGILVEELFGAVTPGAGVALGAVAVGGAEAGPLLLDCASTGFAIAIKASEPTVIINLFMDCTPTTGPGRGPCLSA
jgi:hypothetical protein